MRTNPGCASCDYFYGCNRTLIFKQGDRSVKIQANAQEKVRMSCVNQVQEICKDCMLFSQQRCASWKVINGKEKQRGSLSICPQKIPLQ